MHFQLFQAPLQQLLLSSSHLDKVGGVEGEPLVISSGQLPGKSQLVCNGGKVWQVLQVVEGAPREDVAGHPTGREQAFRCFHLPHKPQASKNRSSQRHHLLFSCFCPNGANRCRTLPIKQARLPTVALVLKLPPLPLQVTSALAYAVNNLFTPRKAK